MEQFSLAIGMTSAGEKTRKIIQVTHVQAMAPSATRALYPHGACPDPQRGAHTSCS